MEFGPLPWGARSILGDPRFSKKMQAINESQKKSVSRELFRRFAPAVLRETSQEWFDLRGARTALHAPGSAFFERSSAIFSFPRAQRASSWKNDPDLWAARVKTVSAVAVPPVPHVDYSARLQDRGCESSSPIYRLIESFHSKDRMSDAGETPVSMFAANDRLYASGRLPLFLGHDMDALVLENFVLLKEEMSFGQPRSTFVKISGRFQWD